MTLNFLRRNKLSRTSILLYHNPGYKHSARRPCKTTLSDNTEQPLRNNEPPLRQTSQDSSDDYVETSLRQRAMARIESLVQEISASEKSSDLSQHRKKAINELLGDKTGQEQDETRKENTQHQQSRPIDKHNSPKPPLDVRELQTIAAMAKKLRRS